MVKNTYLYTLNDLFYGLFTSEDDVPVIRGIGRCNRETYFEMFFPNDLYEKYINKSKSNLTWFFNNDHKNKAVKRSLMDMIETDSTSVIQEVHQKCRRILWPADGHAAFDREGLLQVLSCVRINGNINSSCRIIEKDVSGKLRSCRLLSFFEADVSAALARMILTLSVLPDAPEELVAELWETGTAKKEKRNRTQEETLYYCRMLDQDGKKEEAFSGYQQIIQSIRKPVSVAWESYAYTRAAQMLMRGEGHHADPAKALEYFEKGLFDGNPESYYLYSRYTEGTAALEHLKKAAELSYGLALRELGNAYYYGSRRLGCEKDAGKACMYYQKGSLDGSEDGAYCACMLGRICEETGKNDEALEMYRLAESKGSMEAYERLLQLKWESFDHAEKNRKEDDQRRYYMNALSGANLAFYHSLSDTGNVRLQETAADFKVWFEQTFHGTEDLEILLLSENEDRNLEDCIHILRTLYRSAGRSKGYLAAAAEHIKIYADCRHDTLSVFLDNMFHSIRPVYFPVIICDPYEDAASYLFTGAPLFLPCLGQSEQKNIRMNIMGEGEIILSLLKHAVRLPLPSDVSLEIHVFAEHADLLEERFSDDCPGILLASPMIRRTIPVFHDTERKDLLKTIRTIRVERSGGTGSKQQDTTIADGNYYVVCTEDDAENIRIGCALRRELLKMSVDFDRHPFIAVYTKNEASSLLASSMQEGTGVFLNRLNHYDLFPFGSYAMYRAGQLHHDLTGKRAYAFHAFYNPEETRRTYYTRTFNMDSSKAAAEAVMYQLFRAGICLKDPHLYGNEKEEKALASAYEEWLQEKSHLLQAAQWEHERWNVMMLTFGWEQANISQVSSYVQQGNPGHQMNLARLHPFICEWEALRSGKLLEQIRDIVNSLYPEIKVYDPVDFDIAVIRKIPDILTGDPDHK